MKTCYWVITLVLMVCVSACSRIQSESSQTVAPLRESADYAGNPNMPGSDVAVTTAVSQATVVFVGSSNVNPGVGSSFSDGVNSHYVEFAVQEILAGNITGDLVPLHYTVRFTPEYKERAPRKNEQVIIFLRSINASQVAFKILPLTADNKQSVTRAIANAKKLK